MVEISSFDPAGILKAVRMIESLPGPSPQAADDVARLIHDVALHAETMADWALCARLYRRAASYRVANSAITADAWLRHGICLERARDHVGAIGSYRKALEHGQGWPAGTAMAKVRLSDLLMAAEEFEEAASVLTEVIQQPMQAELHPRRIQVNLARCLARTGRPLEAREVLERLVSDDTESEYVLQGYLLLAEICESAGDFQTAHGCYQRILDNPFADMGCKTAAAHRLDWLQRKRLY